MKIQQDQQDFTTPAKKKRRTHQNIKSIQQREEDKKTEEFIMKTVQHQVLPSQLFFTTQRFKTPAKQNEGLNSINPSHHPSSSTSSASSSSSHLPHLNHTHSSDQSITLNLNQLTPKILQNPHIYGRQDRQTDAEMSLVTAETPQQRKNREFRRGKSKQNLTKLSAQSLQALDPNPSRGRRGSRASSIGSGHEALPHPRIPPSALCRHIRTDLPPAMRCRTLLSWATQKAEDLTCKTLNPSLFKPTRFIIEELPQSILNSFNHQSKNIPPFLSSSSTKYNHPHSKRILKIVQSTIKQFIKGICENQVEINWNSNDTRRLDGFDSTSDEENELDSNIDFDSLPPHPQDIKNERKIKELEDWRTRMSYEDNARQNQLTRYGNLIEKLNQKEPIPLLPTSFEKSNESTNEEEEELGRIDTKKLVDRNSILEFGRFLRRKEATQSFIPHSIDALHERGSDWSHLSSNIGILAENLTRIEGKVMEISKKSKQLLTNSTFKLRQVSLEESGGRMSSIEAKILLSSMDGIQLCLKSLNLISSYDEIPFTSTSSPPPSSGVSSSSKTLSRPNLRVPWLPPSQMGKRDLLRALSRSSRS